MNELRSKCCGASYRRSIEQVAENEVLTLIELLICDKCNRPCEVEEKVKEVK